MAGRASQVAAEVLRTNLVGALASQVAVEVLRPNVGRAISSQTSVEVLRTSTTGSRISQVSAEVLRRSYTGSALVSQVSIETLRRNTFGGVVSQVSVEALRRLPRGGAVSQVSVEVLRSGRGGARISQASVEVMRMRRFGGAVSQVSAEVLRKSENPARTTQIVAEVLRLGDGQARVTQAIAEILRVRDGDSRVTQAIAEILRANVSGGEELPEALYPWPFQPNGAYDLVERYGYLSEVLRARNGAEQRRALRRTASGGVSFTCTLLEARELQHAAALLEALAGQRIGVPLWQYGQRLSADCPEGSEALPADTATVPFYADGAAMLWRSPWLWELVWISSVESGSLSLASPLASSWSAGVTLLIPVVAGYLRDREELTRFSVSAGDVAFEFDVPAFFP